MIDIKESFEKGDSNKLRLLANEFNSHYFLKKQVKFLHLSCICECLISRIENTDGIHKPSGLNVLKKYLLNVETWGHYELVLFNNTFFLYDVETIQVLFKQAEKITLVYSDFHYQVQEKIKLYSNVILFFLEHNYPELAINVINNVKSIEVTIEQIYEKLLIKFWDIIQKYLRGEKLQAEKDIYQLLFFLDFIDNTEYQLLLRGIFTQVQEKYGK